MLDSLYTGLSGLQAQQEMINVTANNVANVSTDGFKSSSVDFQDMLSRSMNGSPSGQVGLGVRVATTNVNLGQGSQTSTGVTSNMMIDGNGYFAVQKNGQTLYTRDGNFTLNTTGNLVTSDGAEVEDTSGNPISLPALTNGTYSSYTIDSSGTISGVTPVTGAIVALGQVGVANFANPAGLQQQGDNELSATAASGAAQLGAAGTGGRGSILSGYVESSNVDLTQELSNLIIAQRAFQADSKVVTTSDQMLQTLVGMKE